ncbi:sugar-binding transcriptional regulator [Roseovarius sp. MMSF_3281]|uniref:sugar-binding transcriptional regulator n=1 Tax=Roseovarius sp. MMSF_3281 TaxID=3046694 RepID=UPI00273F6FDC|nr:sugar-binding domain-containing protein [Roseovarius sp. MMSF_3281]
MKPDTDTNDQMREVAWMHYVGGLTQAQIATRRGLSKMKVHRLVQAAHEAGIVKIFVNNVPSDCVTLETKLIERFGLTSCTIVPDTEMPQTMDGTMPAVASAGARFLHGRLESTEPMVVGIGSGRTMSEVVKALPKIKRRRAEFISATGEFAALSAANPFEVIHTLIDKTEGKGFAFTAPLIVDDAEDRDLFLRQKSVHRSFDHLHDASFIMIGIGHIGPGSFFKAFNLLNDTEQAELGRTGVVADLAGNLVDAQGNFVHTGIALRMLGMELELLRTREVIAICAGLEKSKAARAALLTGCLDGFISSRSVAQRVLQED